MNKTDLIAAALSGPETDIIIERRLHASPEEVFDAFLDAEHIDEWWGPDGCQTKTHTMEPRVGGLWHHTMTAPDGVAFPNYVRYRELRRPQRLVYGNGSDPDGPPEFVSTITLEPDGDGTRLRMQVRFPSKAARDATLEYDSVEGGHQTLARLESYLSRRA